MTKEQILELASHHLYHSDAGCCYPDWSASEDQLLNFAREIWLKGHWEGGHDVSNDIDMELKECQDKLNSIRAILND